MKKNDIQISDSFTYKKLFQFTAPSIAMMIFTSIYGIVDGYFVSNYVGKTAFSAVNFIMPVIMILSTAGFMIGTGGSALIAKTMGEGNIKRANEIFSMLVNACVVLGIAIAILGIALVRPAASLLGADGQMLEDCVLYARIVLSALPAFVLQFAFQSFMVTAERPRLGLIVTVAAGCTNIALDALLVGVLKLGLVGAAAATAFSQIAGGVIPLVYFALPNSSPLRVTKARFDIKAFLKTCGNGSSELMSNISASFVGMLYNIQLLRYIGSDGVSAYGVLMYVGMIFVSVSIGYSIGTAPIISYHYGAGNTDELKSIFKKSMIIVSISSVLMFAASELLALPLSMMYVGYDEELMKLTLNAFKLFSLSFLFSGIAIYGSSFFTALNNGLVSALISFLRTLVFQSIAVVLFPLIFKVDGIWLASVAAELMAAAITTVFLIAMRKKYKY